MGVVNSVVLACDLTAKIEKGRQHFSGRKMHPRENPGYAYGSRYRNTLEPTVEAVYCWQPSLCAGLYLTGGTQGGLTPRKR